MITISQSSDSELQEIYKQHQENPYLSLVEKALLAAKLSKRNRGDKGKRDFPSQAELAKLWAISTDTIQKAKILLEEVEKETKAIAENPNTPPFFRHLLRDVESGKTTIAAAYKEIKKFHGGSLALRSGWENKPKRHITREFIEKEGIVLTPFSADLLLRKLDDNSVDCIITDPPYNAGIASWDVGFDPQAYLHDFARVLRPGGQALIFCHNKLLPHYLVNPFIGSPPSDSEVSTAKEALDNAIAKENKVEIKRLTKIVAQVNAIVKREESKPLKLQQVLHWAKSNNPNKERKIDKRRNYQATVEYIVWLTKPAPVKSEEYVFHPPLSFDEICTTRGADVFDTPMLTGYEQVEANRLSKQESPKPFRLIELLMKTHTNKGDVVCDPFHGKGITGLVAFLSGRRFISSELDTRKVFSVQKWRLDDMYRFIQARRELIDCELTQELLDKAIGKKNRVIAGLDAKTKSKFEDFREYFIYRNYIESVVKKYPQFIKRGNTKHEEYDSFKDEIEAIWAKDDILESYFTAQPEVLNLYTGNSDWYRNYDPLNPPEEHPIRKVIEEAYGENPKNGYYYYAVQPLGYYEIPPAVPTTREAGSPQLFHGNVEGELADVFPHGDDIPEEDE